MASTFTCREMTQEHEGVIHQSMGLLDDALKKLEMVARRDYKNVSGLARHLDVAPNLLSRWFAKGGEGKQVRKPKLETIAPILDQLGFQLLAPGEKAETKDLKSEIDRINADVFRVLASRGVSSEIINEV